MQREILSRLDSVPDALIKAIQLSERAVLDNIISILSRLDQSGGQIVLSESNLKLLSGLFDELDKVLVRTPEYTDSLKKFSIEFNKQANLLDEYFIEKFGDFQRSAVGVQVLALSRKKAMDALLGNAARAKFIEPVKEILSGSVEAGGSLPDTIKSIREFVLSNKDVDGRLVSYAKQVAYDDFAVGNRAYSNVLNNQLGAEWFVLRGGLIKTTRPICKKKNGEYFHKSEVEMLGMGLDVDGKKLSNEDLQGRAEGTDEKTIFVHIKILKRKPRLRASFLVKRKYRKVHRPV